jgi:putative ABC transport system permease protein
LFAATVALFLVFRAFARALVSFFARNETRLPPALRLSLAEISARKETAVLSMALAGLSLFLTCLVQFVKDDLLTPLGETSARGKPNLYLVDVQPSQREGVVDALKARNGGADVYASPMVRARLAAVNGKETEGRVTLGARPLGEPDPEEETRRAREREQNLTYRFTLGEGERVVERLDEPSVPTLDAQGRETLWPADATPRAEVSVEKAFAKRAGLALGDTLAFDVQGVRVEAKVTSLRSVSWQNWRPNFFLVAHPSLLEGAPQMNLVATHISTSEAREDVQKTLAQSFPNVSVLDAAAIVRRVADLSTGVAEATRFLASLLLGASLLVLAAGVVATRASRMRHYAILRSLGARDKLLSQSLILEFLWLGGVSGFAGVVAAAVLSRVFASEFLEVDASLSLAPAALLFFGAVGVNIVVGWLSCASVLRRKPAEVLREGS